MLHPGPEPAEDHPEEEVPYRDLVQAVQSQDREQGADRLGVEARYPDRAAEERCQGRAPVGRHHHPR